MALVFFSALAIVFALAILFQRTLYGSAICLLLVLLQVAALFFVLGAEMIALMQVLVYAGAIMVLIVVAVMAAPPRISRLWAGFRAPAGLAALVLGILLGEILSIGLRTGSGLPGTAAAPAAALSLERQTAVALFDRYALITEAAGLLILVAALAVVPEAAPAPESA